MICEATTSQVYDRIMRQQRDQPDYNRKCIRAARWKVAGKCLCGVHAGQAALIKVAKAGEAKRITETIG